MRRLLVAPVLLVQLLLACDRTPTPAPGIAARAATRAMQASESTTTHADQSTLSPIPASTITPTSVLQPVNTVALVLPASTAVSTPAETPTLDSPAVIEGSATPQVLSFEVTPTEADPGEKITLTWETRGDRATICPSARFVLFSSGDCEQVPLSGMMTFTIPYEAAGFQYVNFSLSVEGHSSSASEVRSVSVALKCDTLWFFSDEPQAGICPQNPIDSHAAVQRFERGSMIWIERIGRYFILEESPRDGGGDARGRVHYVTDPLEIMRDTSGEVSPPEGLYAPQSGLGLIWRGDVSGSPSYRESLGWALAPEFGYEALFQCDDALPSGGRSWQTCYLKGPDDEVIVLHPLGVWYLLGER